MAAVQQPKQAVYGESALIPKERYTSRDWLELEYERLWPRVWQMACRLEEIPKRGDYAEHTIGSQSVLIVRESGERIRAFRNSCLHRGTRLAAGCGAFRNNVIRCRFHGWAWTLDGSIHEVPDAHDFAPECVAASALQLPEASVDTWGGFVFVNLDRNAGPLREFLGPVPDVLDKFEPEKMRYKRYRTTVMDCNWKAGLDAFNEVYHIEATHMWDLSGVAAKYGPRSVSRARYSGRDASGATPGSYAFEHRLFENQNLLAGTAASIAAVRRLRDLGPDPRKTVMDTLRTQISINLAHEDDLAYVDSLDELPADMQVNDFMALVRRESAKLKGLDYSHLTTYDIVGSVNFCVYPNLMGPITAGNWILHRFRPNGDDPNSCLYDLIFLHRFGDTEEVPAVTKEWYPDWQAHEWGAVIEQDLANMAHVQRGMHESTYPGLRLNRQEAGLRNFHRFLDRYLL
jgi:phenylpropionate dioxygenase-like ring-hydroxylating dioxygenase large terminal subunit